MWRQSEVILRSTHEYEENPDWSEEEVRLMTEETKENVLIDVSHKIVNSFSFAKTISKSKLRKKKRKNK